MRRKLVYHSPVSLSSSNAIIGRLSNAFLVNSIVLRAFQGIGGSGIYSLVSITVLQVVPQEKLGKYGAVVSSVFVLASVLGPLLGGAITQNPENWP